jgi:UDP-N-acetylglucosamine:LPS N-acetylglucosamine transferase
MMACLDAFEGHEVVLAHYDWPSFRDFSDPRVLRHVGIFRGGDGGLRLLVGAVLSTFQWIWLLARFRPRIVFSTGAEIVVIPMWLARIFLRARCIYLESAARTENPSGTGPLVYPICEAFFVQSESLLKHYGRKARYVGNLLCSDERPPPTVPVRPARRCARTEVPGAVKAPSFRKEDGPRVKVLCIAGGGGHVEEMVACLDAFDGYEVVLAHYDWPSFRDFSDPRVWRHVGTFRGGDGGLRLLVGAALSTFQWIWLLASFRPRVVFSTGAEIAIIPMWLARIFLGSRCIYMESAARTENPSGTGPLVYPICEVFFVQSESLLKHYGPKARYAGNLL